MCHSVIMHLVTLSVNCSVFVFISNCVCVCACVHFSIARAQVSDGGSYTCVASNRAGVDNKHFNLQVYGELRLRYLWHSVCCSACVWQSVYAATVETLSGFSFSYKLIVMSPQYHFYVPPQYPLPWRGRAVLRTSP